MAVPASALLRSASRASTPSRGELSDDPESLLKTLGKRTIGGLAAIGNALDLPGSSVRDLLAGNRNPFDQWLTPFSGDNRTGGRELLEKAGIVGRNKVGKLDMGDVAGFAGEVLLDPLALLSFGASSIGKGAQVLKKAGALPKLSRVSRMTTKVKDLAAKAAPDALEHAAKASGFADTASFLSRHGDDAAGGLLGVGMPFRAPSMTLGKAGGLSETIAGGLDTASEFVKNTAPMRVAGAMFKRSHMGALNKGGKELGETVTDVDRAAGVSARDAFAPHLEEFDKLTRGMDTPSRLAAHDTFRSAIEGTSPLPADMAHLQPAVDDYRKLMDETLLDEQTEGLVSSQIDDLYADYARRQRFFFPGDKSKSEFPSLLLSGKHGSQTQRTDILRDIQGGTGMINRLTVDPALSGVAHTMKPSQLTRQFWDAQESAVDAAMQASGNPNWSYEHSRRLAKWLADLDPRHVSEGVPVFPHNPLEEGMRRVEIGKRAVGMAKSLREHVEQNAVDFLDADPGSVSVRDVFEKAGLDVNESLNLMGQKLGKDASKMMVPKELAEDYGRVIKTFQNPEEVGPVLKAIDKFTALFKVGVLTWPARYVRDFYSAQIQNAMIGAWSPKAMENSLHLLRGGRIKDLQKLGGKYAGLTDEAATKELAREMFSQGVTSHSQGEWGQLAGTSLARNAAADIPGVRPVRFSGIAAKSIPKTKAQANPFNVAGVRGSETQFAPVAAANDIGHFTDAMGRATGYIELRMKGYSPEAAAKKITAAQVDYKNLSQFEQGVMRRAVPFYSFSRGQAEFVFDELTQRPGGRLAQTVRATNEGHSTDDGPLPEKVTQGMSIPLGTLPDGTKRLVTSIGMMHEPTLGMMAFKDGAPSLGGTLANLGSQMHPLPKMVAELAFGESLFQKGRDLEDMEPNVGRTLTNMGDLAQRFTGSRMGFREELPSGKARPFISNTVEHVMSNMPTSRAATTLRTLTDPRKLFETTGSPLDFFPGQAVAMNLLTGLRQTDVSPRVQRGIIIDELSELMKSQGAQSMETVRFRKAAIAEAEKRNPEEAERMRQMNAIANQLLKSAKDEAKQRKAELAAP